MIGTSLGPYKILEPLGAGGMGEVFLAEDTRLGRKVAVKVLPAEFAADPERLARFEQEARAAAALNHPNIAVVHDIGFEPGAAGEGDESVGTHYIVQEYLEGDTLADVVEQGRVPMKRSLALGEDIARALAAAHAAGIVHRDLKPANVFVTPDGSAKVLDFGLAKLTEAAPVAADASMSPTMIGTMAGTVMGTAGYMAPEQVNGEEVDRRADLFAFGCVLYEMVTGTRAFAGQSIPDTLAKVLHSEPEPIDSPTHFRSPELDRILSKCLAKERAARYQYADDLAVDLGMLRHAPDGGGGRAAAAAAEDASPAKAPAWRLAVAVAIVSVALTAVAAWLTSTEAPPPPLRTFSIAFPAEAPAAVFCCAVNLGIAPDDSYLMFGASDGSERIFVRRFDTGETTRIEGATGYMPTISPDGLWIAYVSLPDSEAPNAYDGPSLHRVSLAGGAPFDMGVAGYLPPFWARDEFIYVGNRSGNGTAIGRLPGTGGEVESLVPIGLAEGEGIGRVAAYPENGFVLFEYGGRGGGIGAMNLETLQMHRLVDDGADPRLTTTGHLLWHRAGVIYAAPLNAEGTQLLGQPVPVLQGVMVGNTGSAQFTVSGAGTLAWIPGGLPDRGRVGNVSWLDTSGTLEPVTSERDNYDNARLSPDGARVVFSRITDPMGDRASDLWTVDLDRGAMAPLSTDGESHFGVWSHDGEWVYYQRIAPNDRGDIWRRRADFSGDPEPVLERPGAQWPTSLSSDGQSLAFRERQAGEESSLWLLSLAEREARPVSEGTADESGGRLSPNSELMAYVSRQSGPSQVYLLDLAEGGGRVPVSLGRGNAFDPVWSRDGSTLFFVAQEPESGIYSVAVTASGSRLQVTAPELVVAYEATARAIRLFDVGPDGRLLVSDRESRRSVPRDDLESEIRVTLNWFQELERLSPRDGSRS